MATGVDVTKFKIVEEEPPTRFGGTRATPNPLLPTVKDWALSERWYKIEGLSTANAIAVTDSRTGKPSKTSELAETIRMIRRAVIEINKGADTNQRPGAKAGTVDLYVKVRPKRAKKTRLVEQS